MFRAGDEGKRSLPGKLAVKRVDGVPTIFPAEGGHVSDAENLLEVPFVTCHLGIVHSSWQICGVRLGTADWLEGHLDSGAKLTPNQASRASLTLPPLSSLS